MSRMLTQLGERADLQRMAVTFFLTTRGIPQVYYGTEILMSNQGTEGCTASFAVISPAAGPAMRRTHSRDKG